MLPTNTVGDAREALGASPHCNRAHVPGSAKDTNCSPSFPVHGFAGLSARVRPGSLRSRHAPDARAPILRNHYRFLTDGLTSHPSLRVNRGALADGFAPYARGWYRISQKEDSGQWVTGISLSGP